MKKKINAESLLGLRIPTDDVDEFIAYMEARGWQYSDGKFPDFGYKWIRRSLDDNFLNFINKSMLTAEQLGLVEAADKRIPGSCADKPLSLEGYKMFAMNDEWEGGYIEQVGFVGVASSSAYPYGQPIYINAVSITPQAGEENTAIGTWKFYQLKKKGIWKGGYVSSWGYVNDEYNILGVTAAQITFTKSSESDAVLGNLANMNTIINSVDTSVSTYKSIFKDYYNPLTRQYEIPDSRLRSYFDSQYTIATVGGVDSYGGLMKALGYKENVVLLRIVNRTVVENGQTNKYGKDYLIVGYNKVKQLLYYVDPVTNAISTLDALKVKDEPSIVVFACRRNRYLT